MQFYKYILHICDCVLYIQMSTLINLIRTNQSDKALEWIQQNMDSPLIADTDSIGDTALIVACKTKQASIALALIHTGKSNPGHINLKSDTALLIACSQKLTDVALALIHTNQSKPGHINEVETYTALIIACEQKLTDVALALIDTNHSNPGHITKGTYTALIIACDRELTEVALALIATRQANVKHKTKKGVNALELARHRGLTEVVDALLRPKPPPFLVNLNRACYDVMQYKTRPLIEFLNEAEGNMAFILLSKKQDGVFVSTDVAPIYGIHIDNLTMADEYIVYECFRANTMLPENINIEPYYDIKRVIGHGDLVSASDIKSILANPSLSPNIFALVETKNQFESTITKDVFMNQHIRDIASRRRCQTGQGAKVYNLVACNVYCGPAEHIDTTPEITTSQIVLQVKTKRYPIPFTDTTTIQEVKQLLLRELNLNESTILQFIYGGKIVDNAVLASTIADQGGVVSVSISTPKGMKLDGAGYRNTRRRILLNRTKKKQKPFTRQPNNF